MASKERKTRPLESSLQKLSLAPSPNLRTSNSISKSQPSTHVADSWEEEAAAASSGSSSPTNSPPQTPTTSLPSAPPPTPVTSVHGSRAHDDWPSVMHFSHVAVAGGPQSPPASTGLKARPEKTTAVAGRMIAGALGMRAPTKSEEGRQYERALREKVGREKEERRREEKERERAKTAVWEGS